MTALAQRPRCTGHDYRWPSGRPHLRGEIQKRPVAGGDGFKLDVSFTANRLFDSVRWMALWWWTKTSPEFCAPISTSILMQRFQIFAETGTRRQYAARMSLLTKSIVIAVSSRRSLITVYADGSRGMLFR